MLGYVRRCGSSVDCLNLGLRVLCGCPPDSVRFRELSNVNCEAPIFTCSIDTGATNDVIGARVRL